MSSAVLFSEKQKFNKWWAWVLFLGLTGLFVVGVIRQVFLEIPFGAVPMSNSGLFIVTLSMVAISSLILIFRLETLIKEDGIYVRFFPLQLSFKYINWTTIDQAFVRTYSPIGEYGGWGLRYGFTGKGKAYNVSGDIGLQLVFTNGKKLLIGTQKADELKEILIRLGQWKPDGLPPETTI